MKRRRALRLLGGVGFAGSLAGLGYRRAGRRRVSVTDVDATPPATPAELTAELVDDRSTNGSAATVRITMSNPGDERTVLMTGFPGVFTVGRSEETAPGLTLVATDYEGRPIRSPHCPRPITNYSIPTNGINNELDPGEAVTDEFAAWGQRGNDPTDCVPAGTFTFTSSYQVAPPTGETFDWGFTLSVEER